MVGADMERNLKKMIIVDDPDGYQVWPPGLTRKISPETETMTACSGNLTRAVRCLGHVELRSGVENFTKPQKPQAMASHAGGSAGTCLKKGALGREPMKARGCDINSM